VPPFAFYVYLSYAIGFCSVCRVQIPPLWDWWSTDQVRCDLVIMCTVCVMYGVSQMSGCDSVPLCRRHSWRLGLLPATQTVLQCQGYVCPMQVVAFIPVKHASHGGRGPQEPATPSDNHSESFGSVQQPRSRSTGDVSAVASPNAAHYHRAFSASYFSTPCRICLELNCPW